jgi:uncharacterized damage-inducible protein DinB
MNPQERKQRIEAYGVAHQELAAALERFPREMWQFRPASDQWTIHEIIVHIADSEANRYIRCRRFLAEPGSSILGYDEGTWARELMYHSQSSEDALQLFKWLRHSSYMLIRDSPEAAWSNTAVHSGSGPMTLDDWLGVYARHIPDHIEQMQVVYEAWRSQSGAG